MLPRLQCVHGWNYWSLCITISTGRYISHTASGMVAASPRCIPCQKAWQDQSVFDMSVLSIKNISQWEYLIWTCRPVLTNSLTGVDFALKCLPSPVTYIKLYTTDVLPVSSHITSQLTLLLVVKNEAVVKVHLFGAASSPSCANFGLKKLSTDQETDIRVRTASFIKKWFCVDDGFTSMPSEEEANTLISETQQIGGLQKGGLQVHKFVLKSGDVLECIPDCEYAQGIRDLHKNPPSWTCIGHAAVHSIWHLPVPADLEG